MPVYRLTGVRTEIHLIEAYVRARDSESAEDLFYAVLSDEHEPLLWTQDFDSSDTELEVIERVPEDHEIIGIGTKRGTVCAGCGELLIRTSYAGAAERGGPYWLHAGDSVIAQGVGL
jgi:hypothetical protein